MSALANLQQLVEQRRTIYGLDDKVTVKDEEIVALVKQAVTNVPSAFNTQSCRTLVLLHDEHKKLWTEADTIFQGLVEAGKVPKEVYEGFTKGKLASFKAAAGSILFFEDPAHIKPMSEQFPTYADQFVPWSEQANGMNQYTVWLALNAVGLGANIQHYNPLIDEKVVELWGVPKEWKLRAQIVFGNKTAEAGEKQFKPIDERVKVAGAQ
ncbi:hypothetical protein KEM52_001994 [Ascosphaera acerosa]|nr:hypothetical protein KEM52_001994 [Ascosphaera acerosa]